MKKVTSAALLSGLLLASAGAAMAQFQAGSSLRAEKRALPAENR
jgi:hypothetical protein